MDATTTNPVALPVAAINFAHTVLDNVGTIIGAVILVGLGFLLLPALTSGFRR